MDLNLFLEVSGSKSRISLLFSEFSFRIQKTIFSLIFFSPNERSESLLQRCLCSVRVHLSGIRQSYQKLRPLLLARFLSPPPSPSISIPWRSSRQFSDKRSSTKVLSFGKLFIIPHYCGNSLSVFICMLKSSVIVMTVAFLTWTPSTSLWYKLKFHYGHPSSGLNFGEYQIPTLIKSCLIASNWLS